MAFKEREKWGEFWKVKSKEENEFLKKSSLRYHQLYDSKNQVRFVTEHNSYDEEREQELKRIRCRQFSSNKTEHLH